MGSNLQNRAGSGIADGTWQVLERAAIGAAKSQLTARRFVAIKGLWGIALEPASDPDKLYYVAGPSEENHGLFGYLKME